MKKMLFAISIICIFLFIVSGCGTSSILPSASIENGSYNGKINAEEKVQIYLKKQTVSEQYQTSVVINGTVLIEDGYQISKGTTFQRTITGTTFTATVKDIVFSDEYIRVDYTLSANAALSDGQTHHFDGYMTEFYRGVMGGQIEYSGTMYYGNTQEAISVNISYNGILSR